jgi:hypothetical protein
MWFGDSSLATTPSENAIISQKEKPAARRSGKCSGRESRLLISGFFCLGLAMASRRDFPQRIAKAKD